MHRAWFAAALACGAAGFAFVPESPGELLLWSKEGRVGHLQLLDDNSSLLLGEFQLQELSEVIDTMRRN